MSSTRISYIDIVDKVECYSIVETETELVYPETCHVSSGSDFPPILSVSYLPSKPLPSNIEPLQQLLTRSQRYNRVERRRCHDADPPKMIARTAAARLPTTLGRRGFHSTRAQLSSPYHYPEGPRSNIPFNPLTRFFAFRYWAFMGTADGNL